MALTFFYAFVTVNLHADTLLEFDFENFRRGQVTGPHSAAVPGITGVHNMANNGVEQFYGTNRKLSMTRWAGPVNFPELTFTTTRRMTLESIEFSHVHNHNPGFTTYPTYDVDVQLDSGSGYTSIGVFTAEPSGYFSEKIAVPGLLLPGTYKLRWIALVSPNTNTEFFGLDNIRLVGTDAQVVNVDIKSNSIHLCSYGPMPAMVAAILGSDEFDINDIITDSLRFSGAEVKLVGKTDPDSLCSRKDVNKDGYEDLVCNYLTMDLGSINASTTKVSIVGDLYDASKFKGVNRDRVNIVKYPCSGATDDDIVTKDREPPQRGFGNH
ncbi:MAG: hypothetical protein H0A75_06305 [Candidatus Methanofishera endochildressiae]|uniref:Uncharacterized protein n=1 Tax=Candidatus Methanofishera endochildressiae TaxID=2738884 RepID=A0A7Z0MP23_9GAMM|nr:hypothetical protein [Candidatus Methanofishera endochildressiae]